MLRTNNKIVKNNITNYIMEHVNNVSIDYEIEESEISTPETFCFFMLQTFKEEYMTHNKAWQAHRVSEYDLFREWAAGLAFSGMFDYFYFPQAVDLVGNWLQETEEEKARFSESDAEELATKLIYREMKNNASRCSF